MLEKEVGHPVSPKDNKTSLNPNPKETDGVRSEYITLFSLPASPYQPPMGAPRCQESLLGGESQQAIPSHLPSLQKAVENGPLSGDAEEIEISRLKFVIRERKRREAQPERVVEALVRVDFAISHHPAVKTRG